ncbi:type II secretion system F family protein [Lacticaseibacillus pabuli]|uniref:Type II secretion system F family protein n=1 Tax=Lacticaseibacillus pabuli TaxID=3025672 RepID=A0ABY7WR93_9LACO|nr:type II secretion system F family protein [Lacticaseibacillus sp. KACC 23028]WDF81878.1 type II secretion system F family protein [Lacticaseibacillus sp. KACC 23028]
MHKISMKAQAKCCSTLSFLLGAGFTLAQGMAFLQVQMPRWQTQLAATADKMAAGASVTDAFAAGGFSPVVCTQLGLSGQHGNLDQTLRELSDYLTLLQESRGKVGQLLAYPLTLFGLLTILQAGIVYWVLPQMTAKPAGAMVPQILLIVFVLLVSGGVVLIMKGLDESARYRLLRHVPIVGGMLARYYQYEFAIGAASFLGVGRDLADYCDYLSERGTGPLAELGDRVTVAVAQGEPLPAALHNALVPQGFVQLVEMGQEPELFSRSVAAYAKGMFGELQAQMNQLLGFVQPILFLVLGVQIVVMYARLLLPLYSVIGGS